MDSQLFLDTQIINGNIIGQGGQGETVIYTAYPDQIQQFQLG